jgi:hypothetical protein
MNERIKELYSQAHMVREYPLDDPMRGGNPPTVYWGDERSAERFAELIVAECINIAYEYDKPKLSGPGLAIASNIESHFDIYIEEDGRFVK